MTKPQAISIYWCIPGILETYIMDIYIALQAGIDFKEKKEGTLSKVWRIENMIFPDNKSQ